MLRYLALFALLLVTPAAAQDHFFPTPGNAIVPGYVTMCLNGSNQAVPCSAGGVAAGAAITGCPAQANLFVTSTLTLGCVAALQESDTGSTLTSTGNLLLPDTSSSAAGVIMFGGARFLHDASANSNVFLGHNVANFTTTATNTVAVGESAMLGSVSGTSNTAIGRFAMGGAVTGGSNTCVGTTCMSGLIGGGSNVGIGVSANGVTSASNTTCVGASSCGAATGAGTSALGFQAGLVSTGGTNTFIGFTAGNATTTAANNTFVGSGAGATGNAGAGNTIIGQGCVAAGAEAATVRLGNAGCAAFLDFGVTAATTWSFTGALAATLNAAIGSNAVCNTPGTKTALTVQVWATGCAASSARFKEGIASIDREKALDDVMHFQPVSYTYKPEFNMGSDRHVGFTAEQIGSVDPQWITFESDGVTPHAVKYQEMAPLLAAAIQALKADNDNLRAELEDLKRRVR